MRKFLKAFNKTLAFTLAIAMTVSLFSSWSLQSYAEGEQDVVTTETVTESIESIETAETTENLESSEVAEGETAVAPPSLPTEETEEALTEAPTSEITVAVEEIYNNALACTTVDEVNALFAELDETEIDAFFLALSEEQLTILDAHLDALYAAESTVGEKEYIPAVNYSNAAPFLDPVVGTASVANVLSTYGLAREAESENDNGLELNKTVSEPDANGQYTITLEAWATGEKTTVATETNIPTDIILVIDQSGSMNFCMYGDCSNQNCNGQHEVTTYVPTYNVSNNSYSGYYYKDDNGSYSRAYYCSSCPGWYTAQHRSYGQNTSHEGSSLTVKASADSTEGDQFYTSSQTIQTFEKRITALRSALNQFVAAVNLKAAGADKDLSTTADNVDHHIAIVGFASERGYGNNTEILTVEGTNSSISNGGTVGVQYAENLDDSYYQNALQDVSTTAGRTMVTNAINALAAEGATQVDLGMKMADNILANNPVPTDEKRNRVVIVFTDGTPTDDNGFKSTVANSAIESADTIKSKHGATVYSIGIFSGADGSNPSSLPDYNYTGSNRENRFMHLMSSNYLGATAVNDEDKEGTLNSALEEGQSYYLSASDSETLNNIFQTISQNIESGGSSITLDEKAVIKDIIADSFTLPEGADASSIKVYTSKYTENGFLDEQEPYTATVEISEDRKTISVTNFDFAENWVGTETDSSGNVTYRGKKLIVTIPIVVREDFFGGNGVPSNGEESGIYENADAESPIEAFEQPSVDVPVATITPTVADQNIYLTNSADLTALLDGTDPRINGTNNAYVTITYNIKNEAGEVVGYFTVNKGETVPTDIVWISNGSMTPSLDDDATYTVECVVDGTNDDGVEPAETVNRSTGTATANVNVFKPVLTFKDDSVYYGADEPVYDTRNKVGNIVWKHGDTVSTDDNVTMIGDAPSLTLTYIPDSDAVENGLVVTTKDYHVNVKVEIDGVDITNNHVTFVHETCSTTNCGFVASKGEFMIHILSLPLTINKAFADGTIPQVGETFIFTVKGTTDTATADVNITVTLVVEADCTVAPITINNLPIGDYTVTEDMAWSWRYQVVDLVNSEYVPANSTKKVNLGEDQLVTFTNQIKNNKWIDSNAYCENTFREYDGTGDASSNKVNKLYQ